MAYKSLFLFAILSLVVSVTAGDGFMVFRGIPEHSLESMPETQASDLISHVNNLPPVHNNVNRDSYPHTDLFEGPSANILIAIDSATSEMLKDFTDFFNKENKEIILTKEAPESSLTSLTSVMTGSSSQQHGILGESWKINSLSSIRAFSKDGNCLAPKISDTFAVLSGGNAKVVAVSGSKFMTSALGLHSEVASAHPEWNYNSLYFVKGRGLVDLYTGTVVYSENFVRKDALSRLSEVKTNEGLLLISEMVAIDKIPEILSKMESPDTDIADFIAVGISSVAKMVDLHGKDSEQARLALFLLDRALNEMIETVNEMYQGKVTIQIIGLGGDHSVSKSQSKAVQDADVDDDDDDTQSDDDNTYTADQVYTLNAFFWVSILLIVVVIGCIYTLTSMDMLYTSIVYRTVDGPRPIQDVQ